MDGRRVDSSGLLSADVGTILEISVLTLLLRLEVQPGKATEILLDDGLVDGGTTTNAFTIVMSDAANDKPSTKGRTRPECQSLRAPPICFALDVPENDILDSRGHTRNLPWD